MRFMKYPGKYTVADITERLLVMKDPMDDFVDRLQGQIFDETKATYGEEVFSMEENATPT